MMRFIALAFVLALINCDNYRPPTGPDERPSFSSLDGYTDEEIYEMYQSGQLQALFPTWVRNVQISPGISKYGYWSKTSYDYLASVRKGWARAELYDGNYFVQGSPTFPRSEGSDLLLNVEEGHFSVATGDIHIPEPPCGLRPRGTGGFNVYNAVAIEVKGKLLGLKWSEQGNDFLSEYGFVWENGCEPESPPTSGGEGDQCWYCEHWVYEDEDGDIVEEEEICWEVDWSVCEGLRA
jgi:hypothetical protein